MDRNLNNPRAGNSPPRPVERLGANVLRSCRWAALLVAVSGNVAAANTVWLGTVDNNWSNAANWDLGVPNELVPQQRAQIEAATDLVNWPVIKTGSTINFNQRVFLPLAPIGAEPITYGRLTIESGATLNATNDFRAGEDAGNEFQKMIASLTVAGDLVIGNRARFGNNDYMEIDVDVTGSMVHTSSQQAFRIGGGEASTANFTVSGTGFVSTAGAFEMGEGGLLTLSDDATVQLFEYEFEDEDELGNPIIIPVTKAEILEEVRGFVAEGLMIGATDTYTGSETLLPLGNGLSYFEDANSISIVAAATMLPGDFNLDGFVDAADYVVWRDSINTPDKYTEWAANFGAPFDAPASVAANVRAVPEGTTIGLAVCAIAAAPLWRRRGRNV